MPNPIRSEGFGGLISIREKKSLDLDSQLSLGFNGKHKKSNRIWKDGSKEMTSTAAGSHSHPSTSVLVLRVPGGGHQLHVPSSGR